jgi:hypothetical protein
MAVQHGHRRHDRVHVRAGGPLPGIGNGGGAHSRALLRVGECVRAHSSFVGQSRSLAPMTAVWRT